MSRPTIELSMIVRDGAASLDRCLSSVAGLVDRIVIGDTGSTDESAAIARKSGAEILSIPWANDFAAARNQVLQASRCDWILVLDADEMLEPAEAAARLPALLADTSIHAYTLPRWDYVDRLHRQQVTQPIQENPRSLPDATAYSGYVTSFHTRLFRRNSEVFFKGCVHEQITDQIDLLGLERKTAPLTIHHFGYVETPAALQEEKIRLYHQLGHGKASSEPENFDAHLQLGIVELLTFGHTEDALRYLRRAAELRPRDERAHLYQGICLLRLGKLASARTSLLRAYALGERGLVLYDAMGDCFLRVGDYGQSLAAYRKAHALGSASPLSEAKRGAAEVHIGQVELGLNRIRKSLQCDPSSYALQQLLEISELAAAKSSLHADAMPGCETMAVGLG